MNGSIKYVLSGDSFSHNVLFIHAVGVVSAAHYLSFFFWPHCMACGILVP